MILHLMSAGVPINWTIVALYKSSYGIALNSAIAWQAKETADELESPYKTNEPTSPHYLIEVEERDGQWKLKHHELFMDEAFLKRQEHDQRPSLIQFGSSPLPLPPLLENAVTDALAAKLREFGYLISRSEWERRYPGRTIIQKHFNDFSQAHADFRRDNPNGEMPFELRHAPYMEVPKDFRFPFSVSFQNGTWLVLEEGKLIKLLAPASEDEARSMMRLLNSGYEISEIPALLAEGPIE